jgi:hypothetical protein
LRWFARHRIKNSIETTPELISINGQLHHTDPGQSRWRFATKTDAGCAVFATKNAGIFCGFYSVDTLVYCARRK